MATQDVDVALADIMDMVVDGGDPVRLELVKTRTGELIFGPAADDNAVDLRLLTLLASMRTSVLPPLTRIELMPCAPPTSLPAITELLTATKSMLSSPELSTVLPMTWTLSAW